jgi:hypothetical protein
VPAAAVIPALRMHRTIAAVKKLVVGLVLGRRYSSLTWHWCPGLTVGQLVDFGWRATDEFTLNKSECSKQAFSLNVRAWNNRRGSRSDFIGFTVEIMINRDKRGHSYFCARGEIFGPQKDALQRKHLPSLSSLIKNESQRIEGD